MNKVTNHISYSSRNVVTPKKSTSLLDDCYTRLLGFSKRNDYYFAQMLKVKVKSKDKLALNQRVVVNKHIGERVFNNMYLLSSYCQNCIANLTSYYNKVSGHYEVTM